MKRRKRRKIDGEHWVERDDLKVDDMSSSHSVLSVVQGSEQSVASGFATSLLSCRGAGDAMIIITRNY
jgi:hypothetical protein